VSSIGGEWRYLDCIAARAGKGRAMMYVASRYGIMPADVVAAGDSGNDLLMLGPVDGQQHPAIVMSNSHPEVGAAGGAGGGGVVGGRGERSVCGGCAVDCVCCCSRLTCTAAHVRPQRHCMRAGVGLAQLHQPPGAHVSAHGLACCRCCRCCMASAGWPAGLVHGVLAMLCRQCVCTPTPEPHAHQRPTTTHAAQHHDRHVYTPKAERAGGLIEGMRAIIADKLRARQAALASSAGGSGAKQLGRGSAGSGGAGGAAVKMLQS
jgi:hypothetical protein